MTTRPVAPRPSGFFLFGRGYFGFYVIQTKGKSARVLVHGHSPLSLVDEASVEEGSGIDTGALVGFWK
jgi:hypothetical protein